MKRYMIIVLLILSLVPFTSNSQDYQYYCEDTFPYQTYPGLNEFCLYLIGDESMVDEEYPGYSYLYFKDKAPNGWGIYRDYGQPGYPSIDFIQLMDLFASDLTFYYGQNDRDEFDIAMRDLVWSFHDIHIKFPTDHVGMGIDAEYVVDEDGELV